MISGDDAVRETMLPLFLLLLVGGCATPIYGPQKSQAEAQADVENCKAEAKRRHSIDPVAALNDAYDCLRAKGYQVGKNGNVRSATAPPSVPADQAVTQPIPAAPEKPPKTLKKAAKHERDPALPCAVPCKS
jgi:hypothetical protein